MASMSRSCVATPHSNNPASTKLYNGVDGRPAFPDSCVPIRNDLCRSPRSPDTTLKVLIDADGAVDVRAVAGSAAVSSLLAPKPLPGQLTACGGWAQPRPG